jgi:glycerophosphoryl diester phosphodiesterase
MAFGLLLLSAGLFIPGRSDALEIIAHRGASFDAPENTLASFKLAWQQGADGIEGDFHLTRDGQIVCMHDPVTGRTADRRVVIADSTLDELRRLDVGAWKGAQWAGERIATLAEVLATVPAGKKILLEIKCGPHIMPAFKAVLVESGLRPEQLRIIAFDPEVIAAARRELPAIKAYWLTDFKRGGLIGGAWQPSAEDILATLERTRADGVDCGARAAVDKDLVGRIHTAGKEFHVWTVDDPVMARRLIEAGVDSITSNRAVWLRGQLTAAKE